MSINDIREELKSLKNIESKPNEKTIDDILDNNIKLMEDFVNTKVINIYARPWNKLEVKQIKKVINSNIYTYRGKYVLEYECVWFPCFAKPFRKDHHGKVSAFQWKNIKTYFFEILL